MSVPRRVLVTGASGFIGRPAVVALQKCGYETHVVSRNVAQSPIGTIQHQANLLDFDEQRQLIERVRPTHLVHLAWSVEPGRFWTDFANLDWVAASLSLVRAFAEGGGQRAVFAGTCAEYDWSFENLIEHETPLRPKTLYGAAKLGLWTIIEALGRQTGVSVAWGRLFFVFGPGEASNRLVSDICSSLLTNRPVACTEGRQQRDFLHVADAASALVALLSSEKQGPVNIARGQTFAVRDIVLTLARQIGRPDLIQLGARPSPVDEPMRLAAAAKILTNEVGFLPCFDMERGLADTLAWWRQEIGEGSRNP